MAERALDTHGWDNDGELILTGSSNAYVAATARPITGYYQGLRICGKANHTNSGAATLNINGIGAAAIRKAASTALVAGDIVSGKYYDFVYDTATPAFQAIAVPVLVAGSVGTTEIADDAVTNAKLANMAQATIKGRQAGAGTGDPEDLTATQGRTALGLGTAATQNTGTSGANVPLLNGANTWADAQLFSSSARSTSSTGGIGYATGSGGTVTQITSKGTTVTINTICGEIVTHNQSLNANVLTGFAVSNSACAANDLIIVNVKSVAGGGDTGNYHAYGERGAAGSFVIRLRNVSAGPLGEAVTLQFAIMRAVIA